MRTASVMRRGAATLVIVLAFPVAAWPQAPPQAPMRLSLDDAVQLALNRNQAMRAQRLAIDASQGRPDHGRPQAQPERVVRRRRLPALLAASRSTGTSWATPSATAPH